jgi:hypothetical protein
VNSATPHEALHGAHMYHYFIVFVYANLSHTVLLLLFAFSYRRRHGKNSLTFGQPKLTTLTVLKPTNIEAVQKLPNIIKSEGIKLRHKTEQQRDLFQRERETE